MWRDDILAHAYALSRANGAAPGVDGETFADIEAAGRDHWFGELREELRSGRYRPQPVRRVMIPKASGVGHRPLGASRPSATGWCRRPRSSSWNPSSKRTSTRRPTYVIALLGGEGGLRVGEIVALEWADIDLDRRQISVRHSDWRGQLTSPKNGRGRFVAMTERVTTALRKHRHLRSARVLCLDDGKLWLKAPVMEADEQGHRRMSGGKKTTQGTPQGGVASPLLANIYMHRFIKAFRQHGLDRRYGAVLVTYADDFVILCRHGAAEVLETTRRWMTGIGLTLNEDKTRLLDARCDAFDFLGYTFGPMYSPRTGGRYHGVHPSGTPFASGCGRATRHRGRTSSAP